MNQPTEGRILLVGEGNFSLSASLIENGTVSGAQLTASCIDTFTSVKESHCLAASNIDFLEKAGATVLFEVDAIDLHNHPDIKFFEYERVIFNFPLADRHNIKKNRALLSDFFSSVKNILDPKRGQVMVTLCKGQGGTPADQPLRSWHDSWQVVSMAANAGLILTHVYPFQPKDFPRYQSVGFRFQDKGFNIDNALTHVFEVAGSAAVPGADTSERFIPHENDKYTVCAYIRRKLDRWCLLEKANHPLYSLHHHFESRLCISYPALTVLPCNHPTVPRVLSSYKPSLSRYDSEHLEPMDAGEADEGTTADDGCQPPSSKELKDLKNLEKVAADLEDSRDAKPLTPCHTQVLETDQDLSVSSAREPAKSFRHGVEIEPANKSRCEDEGRSSDDISSAGEFFLPLSSPVFVIHRISQSGSCEPGGNSLGPCGDDDEKSVKVETDGGNNSEGSDMEVPEDAADASAGAMMMTTTHHPDDNVPGGAEGQKDKPLGALPLQPMPSADALSHLHCSLFENLPHLSDCLNAKKSSKAVLMSGTVFRNCSINPFQLPVSHEMVFLTESQNQSLDDLANQLCAALRAILREEDTAKVKVRSLQLHVVVGDTSSANVALSLEMQGAPKCLTLGHVFHFEREVAGSQTSTSHEDDSMPAVDKMSSVQLGAVLYLDNIAFHALHLPDVRLLWSESDRFINQFSFGSTPAKCFPCFQPFNLYPMRFVHDISFWENPNALFDEGDFLGVVREVADDVVTSAKLTDKFESAEGKVSRCYRLVFQSHDCALSYIASWKLQNVLRLKVAQHLGVTLR